MILYANFVLVYEKNHQDSSLSALLILQAQELRYVYLV